MVVDGLGRGIRVTAMAVEDNSFFFFLELLFGKYSRFRVVVVLG